MPARSLLAALAVIAGANSPLLAQHSLGTGFPDCNGNGVPDSDDIAQGTSQDCNENGVPDECDIASGTSQDCNLDGIPDECLACPPVDLVFVMDTSGSMSDEAIALCGAIDQVVMDLMDAGIVVNPTILGITQRGSTNFPCLPDSVANRIGTSVPGSPGESLNSSEDWGPATAVVADGFGWMPGALRVIVPISDEGAQNGNSCEDPGPDRDAIENAIQVAVMNDVVVSPIAGTGSNQCVIDLAQDLAAGTGGVSFLSTQPDSDIADAIIALVLEACSQASDCNMNGIPDECEPDSDGDGTIDDCETDANDLDCVEFDRFEDLTGGDTLTLLTNAHNPNPWEGYLHVKAVDGANQPIGFDHLVGNLLRVDGIESFDYGLNAVDFRAAVAEGALTDVDGDGHLDLNDAEYSRAPGEILVPRFLGQEPGVTQGELILIGLSGGARFDTTVDLLIYNDNEVVFSSEHTFRCWDRVPLLEVSSVFRDDFLAMSSGNDPGESLEGQETGWYRLEGAIASSTAVSLPDPAIYAVHVERMGVTAGADLPWEQGARHGHLLPRGLFGDDEEVPAGSTDDPAARLDRRKPGSLLLFPEFDNRGGVLTVVTVTNVEQEQDVRLHYVYVGRYSN